MKKFSFSIRASVGAGIFLVFGVLAALGLYTYRNASSTAGKTDEIRTSLYPALIRAQELTHDLETLKRLYLDAVSEEDEDLLQEAGDHGAACLDSIMDLKKMGGSAILDTLSLELEAYVAAAGDAVGRHLEGEQIDLAPLSRVSDIFTTVERYKKEQEDRLEKDLRRINLKARSHFRFSIGLYLFLALLLVAFFVLIATIIQSIRSLKKETEIIAGGNLDHRIQKDRNNELGELQDNFETMRVRVKDVIDHLDHKVRERTRDISDIMDHVKIGLMTVGADLKTGASFSDHTAGIFGRKDLGNRRLSELLYPGQPERQKAIDEVLAMMFTSEAGPAVLSTLLPDDFIPYKAGTPGTETHKFLKLLFDAIPDGKGGNVKLMLSIEDVTAKLALDSALKEKEKENSENLALVAILTEHGLDTFLNFVAKQSADLVRAKELLESSRPFGTEEFRTLNRIFHTTKGDAASFRLAGISSLAHELETAFMVNDEEGTSDFNRERRLETAELAAVLQKEILRIRQRVGSLTGQGDEGETRGPTRELSIMVSIRKINQILDQADRTGPLMANRQVIEGLIELKKVPVRKLFNRFPGMAERIASRSGKRLAVKMNGDSLRIDAELLDRIGDPLVHLVRNAADHGVEAPEVRASQGKPESGSLFLGAEESQGRLRILVEDDGGGINTEKLGRRAQEKGILSPETWAAMNPAERQEMIFYPGLSSKEDGEITEVSGRGVGLDVVRQSVRELGGEVIVHSETGKGTRFTLEVPLPTIQGP